MADGTLPATGDGQPRYPTLTSHSIWTMQASLFLASELQELASGTSATSGSSESRESRESLGSCWRNLGRIDSRNLVVDP